MSKKQKNPEPPKESSKPAAPPPPPQPTKPTAAELLKFYPELEAKLTEAMVTGRFMVTVHCQLKKPGSEGDLQHYLFERGYPANDILTSLAHCGTNHLARNDPNADTKKVKGWV